MFSDYSIKMADLYQAYGGGTDEHYTNFFDEDPREQQMPPQKPSKIQMQQQASPQQVAPPMQQPPPVQQQMPKKPVMENFQNLDNLQDYYKPPVAPVYKRSPSYSFWDRMAMKRPEVIKLAVFGLVIVLAISLERIGTHYLTKYLSDNMLTDFQEFMLRFSYPVMVFLLLWIIKAM
jgi:hypothetical protein